MKLGRAGNVYLLTGNLIVPDNITLTIEEGSIIKFRGPSWLDYSITVPTGGTLNVNGTSTDPVIFTSYRDDSAGGDTNGGGASSGARNDYLSAIQVTGGTATVSHGIFRYSQTSVTATGSASLTVNDSEFRNSYYGIFLGDAGTEALLTNLDIDNIETPFSVSEAQANIAGALVSNAVTGLDVRASAKVVFRGNFNNISGKAIKACRWDQSCAVDAAYVDWGSVDGPMPSGSSPLVCGKVTTSPWLYASNTYDGSLFTSNNCDSSPGPGNILGTNVTHFQGRMALKQIDCGNGNQDACNAINTAMTCLGGAMNVAQSTAPWQLPPAGTSQEIEAFSAAAIDGVSNYVSALEELSVPQFSLGFFAELSQVLGTMLQLGNAYSSCAP